MFNIPEEFVEELATVLKYVLVSLGFGLIAGLLLKLFKFIISLI